MKNMFNLRALLALAAALAVPVAVQANTYTKADNTNSLNQAASWGGTAPGSGDIANWSGTYSAGGAGATNSLTAVLPGSALSWQGITVGAVSGTALTTNTIVARTTNITVAAEAVVNGFNVVTITTAANHSFEPGQSVTIAGVTPSGYNGTYIVAGVPAATQFTYTNATGSLGAGTVFGTVQSAIYIGGAGTATANSKLTIGSSGIDLTSANVSVVVNDNTNIFNGNQQWKVPAGRVLRFSNGGVSGATARADTSGSDGTIEISGGGVVSLNEGGSTGFTDANSFAPFTGNWQVDSGTTLRALRNGASAFGSGSITLNGGTLAVGGISGDVGSWTWNTTINLNPSTTSYISEQNVTGSGRSLLLSGSIGGSGNLVFIEPLIGATTFTSQDLGFILSGSETMSGTVTIGGPVENGVPGRLTYVRVGGNATGTSTATGAGSLGSLGSATSIIDNGVLSFTLTGGYSMPGAISGTGSLRIGSLNNATGTGGYIGDAYQNITLTGANTYSGQTIINAGTLTLGAGATLPNTSLIAITTNSINGGAVVNTLDVSSLAGGYLMGSGQTLNLNGGQITGTLTCGLGSTNIFAPGGSNTVGNLNITGDLHLSGGTNTFVLDINNTPANDTVTVSGTLTATGVTTLQFVPPGTGLNAGTYTLITAGTMDPGVTAANFAIAGLVAGVRPQTFSIQVSGNQVELVVVGSPGNLIWVGDGTANLWNVQTTSNWFNTVISAKDIFVQNDQVTFDDTGLNTPAVNLTTNLRPVSVTVTGTHNYTFSGAGQLAGTSALTVSGTGTLFVNNSNSFTGAIAVNGGGLLAITNEMALNKPATPTAQSLTLDNTGGLLVTNTMVIGANTNRSIFIGTGGGTLSVSNGATLTVSNTIGDLSGSGILTKTGNGTLILSATNNNYGNGSSGTLDGTVVKGGTVVYGSGAGLSKAGNTSGTSGFFAVPFELDSGVVDLNGMISYQPNFVGSSAASGTGVILYNGTVNVNGLAGVPLTIQDSGATPSGWGSTAATVLHYTGGNNPNTLTIGARFAVAGTSSTSTRTFTVEDSAATATEVNFTAPLGVVSVNSTNQDGRNVTIIKNGAGTMQISAANTFPVLQVDEGTLRVNHLQALGADRTIAAGTPNQLIVTAGVVDLNGFSPAIGGLSDNAASTGLLLNNGGSPSTLTLGYSLSGTVFNASYNSVIADGTGAVALNKIGTNTQTLAGNNTYSGIMTVSNGTLVVASPGSLSAAGGVVAVETSATLGLNGGSILRPVLVNNDGNVSLPGAGTMTNLTFANNGAMNFDVATGGTLTVSGTDGVTNNGAAGSVTINITGATPAAGTYTLIAYSGSLKGAGFSAYKLGSTPIGATYSLVNNPGVSVNLVVVPALVWSGAQSTEWSTNLIGGLMNWTLAGAPTDYTNGATVLFDDTLTGTNVVDVSVANVTPANVFFNNNLANYVLQGAASIVGTSALAKTGTNVVTILNANTYSGGTTLAAGTLQLGNANALGTGALSISGGVLDSAVANLVNAQNNAQNWNGSFAFAGSQNLNLGTGAVSLNASPTVTVVTNTLTIGGPISGGGNGLTKAGNGALTLSGGSTISGSVAVAGGALNLNGAGTDTFSRNFYVGNTNAGNAVVNQTSGTVNLSSATANAISFGYDGSAANGRIGSYNLSGGTLNILNTVVNLSYFGAANGTLAVSGGTANLAGVNYNASASSSGAITLSGGGRLNIGAGGFTDTGSGTHTTTLGAGTIGAFGNWTNAFNISLTDASTGTTFNTLDSVDGVTARTVTLSGALSGAGALKKSGAGTLVLAGTNNYAAATVVSNGTLLVNGSIGGTGVTVAGGTLGGNGTVAAPVTVGTGGTLAAGANIGTFTISSTLTFHLGATNFTKINATTSASDLVQGFPGATYAGTLVVSNLAGTVTNGQSFQIFSAGGTGGFGSITPALTGGLNWNFNAASGVLSAASSIASNPTNITFTISGGTMLLAWPADHLGWLLQSQTNSLSTGLGTNWVDWPGSDAVVATNLTINAANPTVFFRLRHP